ncbi:putative ribonuclease H-like domain-containing protein [Tanacetum coccineum]
MALTRQLLQPTYHRNEKYSIDPITGRENLEEESAPIRETSAPLAPKPAKQLAAKRNQERVKSILLLPITDEYILKFHNVVDAKSLWVAIKSSLDKSLIDFQKLISQLEVHGAPISKEDINQKFLRSLPPSWNQIALIMRNKPDIDEIDIDDQLYINGGELVLAMEIGVSTAGGISQVSTTPCAHDVACSFFAQPTTSPQLENEDFQQIDEDDLEELDLRWQVAISGRNQGRRSYGDNGRSNAPTNESSSQALVAQDGLGGYDWSNDFEVEPVNYAIKWQSLLQAHQVLLTKRARLEIQGYELALESLESRILVHEKNELAWESSKNLDELLNNQMSARDKTGLGYGTQLNEMSNNSETDSEISLSFFDVRSSDEENTSANDRFFKADGFHAIPPPIIGNFLTPRSDISFAGLDEYAIRKKIIKSKTTDLNTKTSETVDDEDDVSEVQTVSPVKTNETQTSQEPKLKTVVNTGPRVDKPVWDNTKRVNHQKFSKYPHLRKTFVPSGVLTRTGLITPVKQNEKRQFHKTTLYPAKRPVSTTRWVWRPKGNYLDHVSKDSGSFMLKKAILRSGYRSCSVDRDELKFNLFSISQMCDKKNSVLFTETECLILSPSFKLLDESQVVLRAPRKDDVTEFKNHAMNEFCAKKGIKREFSMARTPQQNGVAERKNRTLIEAARTMLADSLLPIPFWAEAVNTVCYVLNRVLVTKPQNKTPYELLIGPIPTLRIHKDHPKDQILEILSHHSTRGRREDSKGFFSTTSLEEPKTISQALQDESWVEAMQEELLQFKLQKVWVLVDLPYGKKEEGIDYDEVFAPVARIGAIRLFLAFASYIGFTVYQMDVQSAFLYGTIKEEVYVHQPPGFVDPAHPNKVYKVIKALYGLHQAPRAWYETLSSFLMENGFRRGTIDKTLFIKKKKSNIMLVQVYVDGIIFGSTKKSMCIEFEECMHKRFQMSSMDKLTFFLGLQVKQQPDGIFISQDKYVADILKKFDFLSIRTATTPIESNKPLVKDEDGVDVDVHVYRSMIGSLMYLTASRPDIMFAVCACARFQVTPKASHLNAVKRIFRYLKHQPKLGLWYPRDSPFELEAYSDSDYGGASLDRKSTTGGCQFLGRRLISWQCKKHTIVANSTTEA